MFMQQFQGIDPNHMQFMAQMPNFDPNYNPLALQMAMRNNMGQDMGLSEAQK